MNVAKLKNASVEYKWVSVCKEASIVYLRYFNGGHER